MNNRRLKLKANGFLKLSLFWAFSSVVFFAVFQSAIRAAATGLLQSPSKSLVALNLKFNGASSCNNSRCHGGADAAALPGRPGNEYTVWAASDKHHEAFKTLKSARSKAIAAASDINDASKSDECLSCHALNAPAALHGVGFQVTEGVSCNACHGPSEKWLSPHSSPGWLEKQRIAIPDHQKLLQTEGIYDTKPLLARADRCTSCHLAIDAKLIKAGHPQPLFEIAYFSDSEPKHWRDPDGLFVTKLWATGQAVCLRDAALQVADRLKGSAAKEQLDDAIKQTQSHYQMLDAVLAQIDVKAAASLKSSSSGFEKDAGKATDLSGVAAKVSEEIEKTEFNAEQTAAILKAIASLNLKSLGLTGQLQQAEGIYELYTGYATATGLVDKNGESDAIAKLLPADSPSGPLDLGYDANLTAAKAHLLK